MKASPHNSQIQIRGAKENNLKNIDLDIPKGKLVVVTGISGSGKSSLVYDIIYKEAQRLFALSMDSTSRRLLKSYRQVDVESIKGLSPIVAVGQKTISTHSGSTFGTISGIYDLLRLLMARFGKSEIDISPLKQERRLFSFNTPYGACKHCRGLGLEEKIDINKLIKDPNLSLREGALVITTPSGYTIYSQVTIDVMNEVCNMEGFDVDTPWNKLTDENKSIIMYGSDKIKIPFGKHSLESRMKWSGITAKPREKGYYRGIIPIMEEILKRDRNANILRFVSSAECSVCKGSRLNDKALSFQFEGKNIAQLATMNVEELLLFFKNITNSPRAAQEIIHHLISKLKLLNDLGLGYLQINRNAASLSSGESQRIRFANMAQNTLSNLLYIFDEPSVGLHSADLAPLKKIIREIVDKGNTVILIEHELEMIQIADWIIDIGPKAGVNGGELIFSGDYNSFLNTKIENSITQKYLLKEAKLKVNQEVITKEYFQIKAANIHNLKNIDVNFQINALNVVCGVSGSGKSSLVMDTLAVDFKKSERKYIQYSKNLPKEIISIDQKPIGKTPRSNPATYTKIFDKIRALFAKTNDAKTHKLKANSFSFNTKGGRCESCQGAGYTQIGMHFIGNVEVICDSCNGKRYNSNILEVKYQGLNISEVLELKITEALGFFNSEKEIHRMLQVLVDLGLGYLSLGQRSTTLSGGEAQRIKLATEIMKNTKKATLYLLDEPSRGLHSFDIEILLKTIEKLKQKGHTIIIVEHHEDIIRAADFILELGPGSGTNGGNKIFNAGINDFKNANTLTSNILKSEINSTIKNETKKTILNNSIVFKGVRTNNLKNIDIEIPKNKLIAFTGVSGSGKSSMAVDTIFKTANQAYLETFPNYIKSRLNNQSNADFDYSNGLTACLSINHKTSNSSLRSTIATYTGIYDLYRLLYSRIARNKNTDLCNCESSFFSFNRQESACTECKGLGRIITTDENAIIDFPENSIFEKAISKNKIAKFYIDKNGQYYWTLRALNEKLNLRLERAWRDLEKETKNIVLYGNSTELLEVEWKFESKTRTGTHKFEGHWKGIANLIDEEYKRKQADKRADNFKPIMKQVLCPICNGERLNKNALEYEIQNLNIAELSRLNITNSLDLFNLWRKTLIKSDLQISNDIISEILSKLNNLKELKLGYLQLNRPISSISGGEMQRIIITGNIASNINGITYIFDEPTRSLHPKDKKNIIKHLQNLRDIGNTVIAVEHDTEFIKSSDLVFEFGPDAGSNGGEIIGKFIGDNFIERTEIQRYKKAIVKSSANISIKNATANNLKNIDIDIPLNQIVGICGVSGSGKTSLLKNVIHNSFKNKNANECGSINGLNKFDECIFVSSQIDTKQQNQTIIAYLGLFSTIAKLMNQTQEAKAQKLKPTFFSYQSKEGKCPNCNGDGVVSVKMDFISDIEEVCPECSGSRYLAKVLEFKYNNKSIADILNIQIEEASNFFVDSLILKDKFKLLNKIGLSYLSLGQKLKNLSLGELQRLKLAKYLINNSPKPILFLLDEPSKGLSNKDIEKLQNIFNELNSLNHSIIMVEHNVNVLRNCDYIIEIGPEAADKGGSIIAKGNPQEIIRNVDSVIGRYF